MDGRVQLPVIQYMKKRFKADYVDSITEAGPNLILSEAKDNAAVDAILNRLKISIENHKSTGVAVVGHHDCAGNPTPKEGQIRQIQNAIQLLRKHHETVDIIGLWVDENWRVHEIMNDVNNDI
jgi:hypothetical protein